MIRIRRTRMCVTHRSLDGTRVLCWVRWDSYEAVALVLKRKDIIQSAQQAIGGEAPQFVLYDVAAVVRGGRTRNGVAGLGFARPFPDVAGKFLNQHMAAKCVFDVE